MDRLRRATLSPTTLLALLAGLSFLLSARAKPLELEFESGSQRPQFIELFTSQGCSSCPPAEHRLNELREHEALWSEVIPIAFHVDYWDRLGWKDPYASPQFTKRQTTYKSEGSLASVYTPAFVIDGAEWRGFFQGEAWPSKPAAPTSVLNCQVENGILKTSFPNSPAGAKVNAAIVGVGIQTQVTSGENRNRRLAQDFVALWFEQHSLGKTIELPNMDSLPRSERYALVVWVSEASNQDPLQAAAHWLP